MRRKTDREVRFGSLVEVTFSPLRTSHEDSNIGIVAGLSQCAGQPYADVITNAGIHRLVPTEHLHVHSQIKEEVSA